MGLAQVHTELLYISHSGKLRQSAKARMGWSYRKNARYKNGQSNTRLETQFKDANGKTKDTMGG